MSGRDAVRNGATSVTGGRGAVYHQGWGMIAAPAFVGKPNDGRYFRNGVEKPFKGYMPVLNIDAGATSGL